MICIKCLINTWRNDSMSQLIQIFSIIKKHWDKAIRKIINWLWWCKRWSWPQLAGPRGQTGTLTLVLWKQPWVVWLNHSGSWKVTSPPSMRSQLLWNNQAKWIIHILSVFFSMLVLMCFYYFSPLAFSDSNFMPHRICNRWISIQGTVLLLFMLRKIKQSHSKAFLLKIRTNDKMARKKNLFGRCKNKYL